jgi:hypothetical protein
MESGWACWLCIGAGLGVLVFALFLRHALNKGYDEREKQEHERIESKRFDF